MKFIIHSITTYENIRPISVSYLHTWLSVTQSPSKQYSESTCAIMTPCLTYPPVILRIMNESTCNSTIPSEGLVLLYMRARIRATNSNPRSNGTP